MPPHGGAGKMLYVNATRVEILSHLPKGMRVAEIGAQAGEYSSDLLKHLEPRELHLIDPWTYHADEYYRHDPANVPQELQDRLYDHVRSRFADHIGTGRVKLHRAKSLEIVSHFPNGFFDMVYVDAMHYHDAVLNDLIAYAPKIRPGGIL